MDKKCVFCELIAEHSKSIIPIDQSYVGMFDTHPVAAGHMVIFPKAHKVLLADLTTMERISLVDSMTKAQEIIRNTNLYALYREIATDCPDTAAASHCNRLLSSTPLLASSPAAFNYGINDGYYAGQTVSHFCVHVMPRYILDSDDPKGGVRNMFNFGNYVE